MSRAIGHAPIVPGATDSGRNGHNGRMGHRRGAVTVDPGDPPARLGSEAYTRATENLRSATKWLLAAFAATGGILIAGLQLTPLGSLLTWRAALAATSALLALGSVGLLIVSAGGLLTDEWVSLAQF